MEEFEFDPKKITDGGSEDYKINTGHIFSELQERWQQFDRQFLAKELQNALLQTLHQKEVFQDLALPEEQRREHIQKAERIYQQDLNRIATSETCFPFPDFSLAHKGGEQQIIDFGACCELSLEDQHFPLFFSLQLALTDILEVQAFLDFHLHDTFYSEKEAMKEFLSNCQKKYATLFTEKLKEEIRDYLSSWIEAPQEEAGAHSSSIPATEKSEFTLNRQVLFMHYALQELGVSRNTANLTDVARLIHGLTGRQLHGKDVRNTDVYKRITNPLKDSTKGGFQADLIFVRNIFEKLGLTDIAEEISKEIRFKE